MHIGGISVPERKRCVHCTRRRLRKFFDVRRDSHRLRSYCRDCSAANTKKNRAHYTANKPYHEIYGNYIDDSRKGTKEIHDIS